MIIGFFAIIYFICNMFKSKEIKGDLFFQIYMAIAIEILLFDLFVYGFYKAIYGV